MQFCHKYYRGKKITTTTKKTPKKPPNNPRKNHQNKHKTPQTNPSPTNFSSLNSASSREDPAHVELFLHQLDWFYLINHNQTGTQMEFCHFLLNPPSAAGAAEQHCALCWGGWMHELILLPAHLTLTPSPNTEPIWGAEPWRDTALFTN